MIGFLFRINQIQRKLADAKISQADSLFAEAGDVGEELVENLRQEGEVARHAVAQVAVLQLLHVPPAQYFLVISDIFSYS